MSDDSQPPSAHQPSDDTERGGNFSRDDFRRFATVTVVLVAMLFLALGLKHRRELKRQGFNAEKKGAVPAAQPKRSAREVGRFKLSLSAADRQDSAGKPISRIVDMIIRDRQNYHQGLHRDEQDEGDTFFNTPQRRAFWRSRIEVHPSVTLGTLEQPLQVLLFQDRVVVTLVKSAVPQ